MTEIPVGDERSGVSGALWGGGAVSIALFLIGAVGSLSDAWGFALFLVSASLLFGGTGLFALFMLSRRGDSDALKRGFTWLFILGAAFYVFGVAALGGYFLHETLQGRLELRWIVFGPAILAALVIFDAGIYRLLIEKNLPTFQRYRRFISRQNSDPAAMRRVLFDEVLLHRSLFTVSRFRWLKHSLIYWGFMLMFATELFAVVFREILPSFGWERFWIEGHPFRLTFDVFFEVSGLMVLAGCILALVWRWLVRGTEQQKYSDTPTALFLFVVVLSGFLVEALRIGSPTSDPFAAYSFVGYALAGLMGLGSMGAGDGLHGALYEPLWYFHVLGSCLFIAYVPVKRLVHSCATPMGRLMNSQKQILQAKRMGVISGLFREK